MKRIAIAIVSAAVLSAAAFAQTKTEQKPAPKAEPLPAKVKCAVMGDEFKPNAKSLKSVYKGKTYYFCCGGCKPAFDKNPEKYAVADKPAAKKPAAPAKPAKKG